MSRTSSSLARRVLVAAIPVCLAPVGLSGCFAIASSMASRTVEQSFEIHRPRDGSKLAAELHATGVPKSVVQLLETEKTETARRGLRAAQVMNDPVARKLADAHAYLLGASPSDVSTLKFEGAKEGTATVRFTRKELARFGRAVEIATLSDDWDALADTLGRLSTLKAGDPLAAEARRVSEEARFISAYIKAYFRGGAFYSLKLDVSALEAKLKKELEALGIPPGQIDALVAKMIEKLHGKIGSGEILGKIGDGGFVTRGGAKYQFPALTATIDPTKDDLVTLPKIDATVVGSDLVRVFLEAFFDAKHRIPAVDTATGAQLADRPLERYSALTTPNVSADEFGRVNDYSNMVEGAVGSLVGRLIRGVGWFSLNNEALAGVLETGISVTARKAAEKLAWDYYESHDVKTQSFQSFWDGQELATLRIVVEGKPEL